jgi:hypothetical protein
MPVAILDLISKLVSSGEAIALDRPPDSRPAVTV